MTRDDWKEYERVANEPMVIKAMQARCEEQGHEFENCCSMTFRLYQSCKWCGEERGLGAY